MKATFVQHEAHRSYSIVMEAGDEAIHCLSLFVRARGLTAARFTGVGSLSEIVLGCFDLDDQTHLSLPMWGQTRVASLRGAITVADGEVSVHPYVVLTRSDGSAWGGHLLEAYVQPRLEISLVELSGPISARREQPTYAWGR